MFLLRLFGGASLEDASGPLSGRAAQRRRLALLAILALEHPRAVGRDKLIAWLWPEHDSERARHLLRDSLYLLRQALGEDSLLSTGDELRLNRQLVRCDVWDFEEALHQDRPETAVRVYAGRLLDGFHVGDAPDLEHWLDAERERLARAYARALEQLAEGATARGDAQAAVESWRRLAAVDPYNSRITLHLMQALEATGDRAGALQQARIHATLLAQEFEAEPDPEVIALAERLRTNPAVCTAADTASGEDGPGGVDPSLGSQELQESRAAPPPSPGRSVAAAVPDGSPSSAPPFPRRRFGRRAIVRPAAAVLGFAAVLSLIWLLPDMTARPGIATAAATADSKAIAVLPCANLSGDPEEEYFSNGLTEELIGVLSQVRALQVVARTSTFTFKDRNQDIREIGEALGVGTLLECSVRRAGERVRVTAQLINAADGFHRWSDTYEHEGTDVFAIQADLAIRIAAALEAELTPAERVRVARPPTASPEAYSFYLKGRYFWNQRSSPAFALASDYLERAIEIDPRYARAYAELANVYSMQGLVGDLHPDEADRRTSAAIRKALALDEDLAAAHAALGGYFHKHAWDSEAAERAHRRALELDPDYPTAHHWYGNLLTSIGRFEEAIAHKRKAVELDLLVPQHSNSLGATFLAAGRLDEALEAIRNAIELDSMFSGAHANLGDYYEATGRLEEAVRAYQRAAELSRGSGPGLARVLAGAGRTDEARAILRTLQDEAARSGIYLAPVAPVFLALGDRDGALEWLERSYRQKHPSLRFIVRRHYAGLEGDPRFLDLLRRVGLSQ